MQTWAAIESRRNVRSFTDQPIPAEDLDQILEAGRRSPSSQNWQPWDFILVTDRERLRELARGLLGFPSDRNWAFLISLGYPADRPLTPVKTLKRRPFSEVVHRGHW
jgi:nitroreductase